MTNQQKKLWAALVNLHEAMKELNQVWQHITDERIHQILAEGYPFGQSFDELTAEVYEWTEAVTDKLEELGKGE